jgi:hypothetical protein
MIVTRDVIAKDESGAWRAIGDYERAAMKDRVVININTIILVHFMNNLINSVSIG